MLTLTLMILVHGGPVSNPSQTNIYWGDQLACPWHCKKMSRIPLKACTFEIKSPVQTWPLWCLWDKGNHRGTTLRWISRVTVEQICCTDCPEPALVCWMTYSLSSEEWQHEGAHVLWLGSHSFMIRWHLGGNHCVAISRDICGNLQQIQAFVVQTITIRSDLRVNKAQSCHVETFLEPSLCCPDHGHSIRFKMYWRICVVCEQIIKDNIENQTAHLHFLIAY